jgi:hypothetical protein
VTDGSLAGHLHERDEAMRILCWLGWHRWYRRWFTHDSSSGPRNVDYKTTVFDSEAVMLCARCGKVKP